jgi:hypothetical protein
MDFDLDDVFGDLYDDDFGDDVYGGNVQFDYYRDRPGIDHHTVFGYDRHFSWDTYRDGSYYGGQHGWRHDPREPW